MLAVRTAPGGTVSDRLPLHSAVLPGRLGDYQGRIERPTRVRSACVTFYIRTLQHWPDRCQYGCATVLAQSGDGRSVLWNDIDCRYTSGVTATSTRPDSGRSRVRRAPRSRPASDDPGRRARGGGLRLGRLEGAPQRLWRKPGDARECHGEHGAPRLPASRRRADAPRQLLHHWRDDGFARIALPAGDCGEHQRGARDHALPGHPYHRGVVRAAAAVDPGPRGSSDGWPDPDLSLDGCESGWSTWALVFRPS